MQEKSQSAVLRIKESLSYKLGSALIEYNQNGGNLFIRLLKLKKNHQRTQILYKDFISLYPHLKYPPIEQCSDYKEALKYKFHLSYLLGQALIKANRTWYKGGYIKFYFYEIQKAKQTYKEFKTLNEEHILESHQLVLIFEDKDKLKLFKEHKEEFKTSLKDLLEVFDETQQEKILNILFSYSSLKDLFIFFENFKTLLNDFNNYEALSTSLKQALAYDLNFIFQNINIIKEWLYSKEFKENYQDKNHPYPSLLNPNKIDYESIPAELAWEMNLPLPRNYGSILLLFGLTGHVAFGYFLGIIGVSGIAYSSRISQNYNFYKRLNQNNVDFISIVNFLINLEDRQRFLSLCDAKVSVLVLTRDPISRLKSGINHGGFKIQEPNKAYNIKEKVELMVDRIRYRTICGTEDKPNLNCLDFAFQARSNLCGNPKIWQYDSTIKEIPNPKSIHYIDMPEIMPDKVFDTLTKLAMKFNWNLPKEKDRWIFENILNYQFRFLLPITISINKEIQIIVAELIKAPKDKIDILPQMSLNTLGLKIGFFLEEEQAKKLFNETHLLEFVKEKMQKYLYALKDKTTSVEKNKVKEEDVLAYLRANPKLARIYKSYFDSEFTHIKAHRPDIVASWKYYQEFERMCEELYRENI